MPARRNRITDVNRERKNRGIRIRHTAEGLYPPFYCQIDMVEISILLNPSNVLPNTFFIDNGEVYAHPLAKLLNDFGINYRPNLRVSPALCEDNSLDTSGTRKFFSIDQGFIYLKKSRVVIGFISSLATENNQENAPISADEFKNILEDWITNPAMIQTT